MSEEVITPTVPSAPLESAPEGAGADESQLSLEKLNEVLGKDFKDVDTALKSVKDTFTFVGKRDEISQTVKDIAKTTGKDETTLLEQLKSMSDTPKTEATTSTPEDAVSAALAKMQADFEEYKNSTAAEKAETEFFSKNSQYENIKNYIKPLKASSDFKDMSWSEFAETDVVKNLMETYNTANEAQSKKSVVESNPRIGAANDKMTNARTALTEGNTEAAKANAVGAVVDLISD